MPAYTMNSAVLKEYAQMKRMAEMTYHQEVALYEGDWDNCCPDEISAGEHHEWERWREDKSSMRLDIVLLGIAAWYYGSESFRCDVDRILDANPEPGYGRRFHWGFSMLREAMQEGYKFKEFVDDWIPDLFMLTEEQAGLHDADTMELEELLQEFDIEPFHGTPFRGLLTSKKFRSAMYTLTIRQEDADRMDAAIADAMEGAQ